MHETIPIFSRYGYYDQEGNLYALDEENQYSKLINNYQILQYNNTFDPEHRISSIFEMPVSK